MEMISQDTDAESAVLDLIETYRQGFLRLDPKRLASVWDREHKPLIYVAMEREQPMSGWAAIEHYFEALPDHVDKVLTKEIDATTIDVYGNTAVAFFKFHSTVKLKRGDDLYRPYGRVSMWFRQTRMGWRATHYHESGLAAQSAEQRGRMRVLAD